MLKSLYSGVTGMRSQQTKMDVISNNIANVSTTGFKAGRVRFQDLISQIDSPAQSSTNNLGGVNPHQVGMGVQVSGTDTIMTGGSLQTTGRSLDFGIQNGDNSFFIVNTTGIKEGETGGSTHQYTRDGGFFADHKGDLVTPSGMRVLGYTKTAGPIEIITADPVGPPIVLPGDATDVGGEIEGLAKTGDLGKLTIHEKLTATGKVIGTTGNPGDPDTDLKLQSFNIDGTGAIVATYSGGKTFILGRVALASFTNPDGLEKAGGNLYNATLNAGDPLPGGPSDTGFGEIRSGFLEMSNVDLANEFTEMIVTSRAYQANSRSITTSDEMIQELLSLKR